MFKGSYLFQGPSFWGPPAVSFRECITQDFGWKTQVTPAETLDVLQREKISGEPEVRIELQQLEKQQRRVEMFLFSQGGWKLIDARWWVQVVSNYGS